MSYTNTHKALGVKPNEWFMLKHKDRYYVGKKYYGDYFVIDNNGEMRYVDNSIGNTVILDRVEAQIFAYAINNPDSVIYLTHLYFTACGMMVPYSNRGCVTSNK